MVAGSDDAVRMAARVASHFETMVRGVEAVGLFGWERDLGGVLGGIGARPGVGVLQGVRVEKSRVLCEQPLEPFKRHSQLALFARTN